MLLLPLLAAHILVACNSSAPRGIVGETEPLSASEQPVNGYAPADAQDKSARAADPEPDPNSKRSNNLGPSPDDDIEEPVGDVALLDAARDYDNTFALGILETLSRTIGPRARGTPGETAAANFLVQTFTELGYDVQRQTFTLPFDTVTTVALTIEGESLPASALRGTTSGEVTAPVVVVPGLGSLSDFAGIEVDGAIVLIERGVLFFQDKIANAAAEGARGVLIFNNEEGGFDGALGTTSPIPAVTLDRSTGVSLRERVEKGPIRGTLRVEGGRTPLVSENIIASSGTEDCRIYVGGHYDTVVDVPGANDNASGTALVVALAQAFVGVEGSDLVCFVGFAAEEAVGGFAGLGGSSFLVSELTASGAIAEVSAMLNLDVASGGTNTVILIGTTDLTLTAAKIAAELDINTRLGSLPAMTGSDHSSFQSAGVPVLFPTIFGARIHVPEDNFDSVEPAILDSVGRLSRDVLQCLIVEAGGGLAPPTGCDLTPS